MDVITQLLVAAVITLVCVCVQTACNIALLYWVVRRLEKAEHEYGVVWRVWVVARTIFAFIGIHLSQIGIWTLSYLLLGCFSSPEEALYFSFASFTTAQNGETALPRNWSFLGPFESLDGIIAFGLSTAFVFTVLNRLQATRIRQRQESTRGADG